MKNKRIFIQVLVKNQADYDLLYQNFLKIKNHHFHFNWQKNIPLIPDKLRKYDIIIIDSDIVSRITKKNINQIITAYSHPAFILLVDRDNTNIKKKLEKLGAIDFIVRQQIDPRALERSIHFFYEKRKIENILLYERMFINNLIDNIPDLIYFKDTQNRFLRINKTMAKMLRLNKPEEAWKKSEKYFPIKKDIQEIFSDDKKIIKEGKAFHNIECKQSWIDGQERWVSKTKVPLFDLDNKLLGMFGLFRDITKQRITDEYLSHFTAKLNRVNRELQDFVFIASHDLQEPLRKIHAFGDLIKNKSYHLLDDKSKEYLVRIMNASQRMQILLGDLLKYSRLATKAQAFIKVNLTEVVQRVVSDMSSALNKVHALIHINPLPVIEADQNQIYELFKILIQNAMKFRQENLAPVINIYNEFDKKDHNSKVIDNHCRIVISDNGIGFDEKYLDRIFGVFQRLHSRTKYQGTGMGLAIARRIVERHIGSITAKSKLGEGSKFIITLPIIQTEEDIIHEYQGKTD
jgi:two-component system sensor kinase FixL